MVKFDRFNEMDGETRQREADPLTQRVAVGRKCRAISEMVMSRRKSDRRVVYARHKISKASAVIRIRP